MKRKLIEASNCSLVVVDYVTVIPVMVVRSVQNAIGRLVVTEYKTPTGLTIVDDDPLDPITPIQRRKLGLTPVRRGVRVRTLSGTHFTHFEKPLEK